MTRRKSGPSGIVGVLLLGAIALVAAIPREAWIVIGVVAAVGVAIFLFARTRTRSSVDEPSPTAEDSAAPLARSALRAVTRSQQSDYSRQPQHISESDSRMTQMSTPVAPSSFRVPPAPAGYGEAKWIPAGEAINVSGMSIPGGLIYVGTSLKTLHGNNDPSLIDPSKPVAKQGDYTVRDMGYWPSYSEISPTARRAYLNWLAGGRKDPAADIGYVFIFFYGLERRAIVDATADHAAKSDWVIIAAELRRLLNIYGEKSGSFRNYAGSLLDWVSLAEHPEKAYLKAIPHFPRTYELPLYIRAALGQAAVDGAPVPAELALAWARLNPTTYLRTPAVRCGDEFDKLFMHKYLEVCGKGMVLPKNRTKLKLVHRPASAGFHGYGEISLTFGETPDVTVLTAPLKKLADVIEAVTLDLESFSRYVGRNPEVRHALEGLLLLPATLWPDDAQKVLLRLKERMAGGMVAISFQDLLTSLDAKTVLTKDKVLALARALESLSIGIEPDVLGGAKLPKPEQKVVLFAIPPGETPPRSSPAYQAAALTLQLASAVATADGKFGPKEITYLTTEVKSWTHLTPSLMRRLMAHLRLLTIRPISLTTLRKKLEPLDIASREAIAAFMATVAHSDGTVSPAEVKMLEKIYKALGVEPKKVFSDVHAAAVGAQPAPSGAGKTEESGFKLDPARIAALQKDTETVSALLSSIFKEEEPPAALPVEEEKDMEPLRESLLGLDEAHSALARLLLSRPAWSREEMGDAAADLDLMVDGALEVLNEASFDRHEVPFMEGEDPLTVNAELLEKMQA